MVSRYTGSCFEFLRDVVSNGCTALAFSCAGIMFFRLHRHHPCSQNEVRRTSGTTFSRARQTTPLATGACP